MLHFACGRCDSLIEIPESLLNKRVRCAQCGVDSIPTSANYHTVVLRKESNKPTAASKTPKVSIWKRQFGLPASTKKKLDRFLTIAGFVGGGIVLAIYLYVNHEQDESAVQTFLTVWAQNPDAASSKMDSRCPDAARTLVATTKLTAFDGNISDAGEDKITVYATGAQYSVHNFRVVPVVGLAGLNMPLSMTISVATDTHQVFSAKPDAVP